jgi:hypothetical protein
MKKLVFTALAVVAFSGVALASSLESAQHVEQGQKNYFEALNVSGPGDNEGTATECENNAIDFYELIIDGGKDNLTLLNDLIGGCH